jgi:hypothetical protein
MGAKNNKGLRRSEYYRQAHPQLQDKLSLKAELSLFSFNSAAPNGRQPQLFNKWKETTSILRIMEEDRNLMENGR